MTVRRLVAERPRLAIATAVAGVAAIAVIGFASTALVGADSGERARADRAEQRTATAQQQATRARANTVRSRRRVGELQRERRRLQTALAASDRLSTRRAGLARRWKARALRAER